jgi:transposase-like protein
MSMYQHTTEYDCPHCSDTLEYAVGQKVAKCANCGSYFEWQPDYSFEEGSWRDCSSIVYTGYTEGMSANE